MDFEVTPDGRLAALTINPRTFVLDLETGATLFSYDHGVFLASSSAVALSRDGRLLAFGSQSGTVRLYEWNGSTYDFVTSVAWPGGAAVTALEFSADGSTLAFGQSSIFIGSPGTTAHIACLDVQSRTVTMEETLESFGLWVNYPIELAVSADGSWFVAALSGDQPQLWDEVRFYEKHTDAPFTTLPTNGSAVALDLSPDEAWMVVATNRDHLTTAQEGGEIQVWRLREPDIDLSPAPRIGSLVDIEVRAGTVGDSVFVAAAFSAEDPPLELPGVGTLYVELASLSLVFAGSTSSDGTAVLSATLASAPALVGRDFFLQGYSIPAGTLTEDWSLLTLLP
jgi:WD40 repeat protein